MFTFIFLIALLRVAAAQLSGRAFVGCASTIGAGAFTTFTGGVVLTSAACADQCAIYAGFQTPVPVIAYSFFQRSSNRCTCTTSFVAGSLILASTSASDPPTCAAAASWSAFRLGTSYRSLACYSSFSSTAPPRQSTVTTLDDCFLTCRPSPYIAYFPSGSGYSCICFTGTTIFSSTSTCGTAGSLFALQNFITPSQYVGRRKRRQEIEQICPSGMQACRISGTDGFECIDTSSELESCGGCMFGQYGEPDGGVRGVNCAAVNDEGYGTQTCRKGQCVDIRS